jgi:aminocarboxymuconate-semialdehyde decarboxylase
MVFGTDYPFGPDRGRVWMRDTVASVEELDLPESDRERIYNGTIDGLMA